MRNAKSAGMLRVLGASLAAIVMPVQSHAEITTSSILAIDSSSGQAIDSSSGQAIDSSSGQAIDSSSVLAIDSSSVLAIDSSSVLAIDSSSVLAIDSSSVLAIDSSSGQAIDSSSVLAIDSSSGQAIDSSSVLAIDSTSLQAIDSSSVLAIDSSSVSAIDSSSVSSVGLAPELGRSNTIDAVLVGPIEAIDRSNVAFWSMGQYVLATNEAVLQLSAGDFVVIEGALLHSGAISSSRIHLVRDNYTAGDSRILVTGIPSSVDTVMGTATIGGLTVDYTPSLSGDRFEGIGAVISVIGTQAVPGGVMTSDRVLDRTDLFFND